MSHKSVVKSKIVGPVHPAVAAQAAQLLVQLLCSEHMEIVADLNHVPMPYNVEISQVKVLASAKAKIRTGWGYEQIVVYLDQNGQLCFYKYEYSHMTDELVTGIENAWQQAYTACAIATALRIQGKQVQVQPTRQGELQIIGS